MGTTGERHLTYRYWTPPAHRDARILVVVGYHRDWLLTLTRARTGREW